MSGIYPTAGDLQAYLQATGLLDNPVTPPLNSLNLADQVNAAVAQWERATGYSPFLAAASDSTRTFDAVGQTLLDLGGGLATFRALMVAGSAYAVDTQFWLRPQNALVKGQPYTWIEFAGAVGAAPLSNSFFNGGRGQIAVTGRWGYGTVLPDDAYQAILARAAFLCSPVLALEKSRGLAGVKLLDLTVDYTHSRQMGPMEQQAATWQTIFRETVARYWRVTL